MMETSQVGLTVAQQDVLTQTFLAMLAEENMPMMNDIPQQVPVGFEGMDTGVEDEFYRAALALSPQDGSPQVANQSLPKIDLEMIDDLIGQSEDMQVEVPANVTQASAYPYPDSSPHLYDTENFPFALTEEVVQTVQVENPGPMISGVIPSPQPMTIDQSQLHEIPSPQAMSVNPSDSMSLDTSKISDSTSDSGVTQMPPQTGQDMEEKEKPMAQESKVEEVPKLPDLKELLVRIRYRSQEMVRQEVKNPNGCLAFYGKPWNFQVGPEQRPAEVAFPDITLGQKEKMTESQYKFTEQVLKALEKGLFLRCDKYGNVYATRFCRSKIFWYSTEKGPIADAQTSGQVPNLTFQKLERNEEVMVFDNMLFQKKLLHYVVNKPTFKNEAAKHANKHHIPISPAIFFTFAQSWNPMNSALSSCLVSMVVNPMRARVQRCWGNEDRHESYDLSNYNLQLS